MNADEINTGEVVVMIPKTELDQLQDANRMLAEEREAWKARAQQESAENDQWQKKLAEVWAEVKALREASAEWQRIHGDDVHHACRTEVERLQALIDKHNDECRTCPVIE